MSGSGRTAASINAVRYYLLWLIGIAVLAVLGRDHDLALLAALFLLVLFFLNIRRHLEQRNTLQDVCNFYEQAHS